MKTVILYFTFGGYSKREAQKLAEERNAPLFRVKEAKDRSLITAFVPGGLYARCRRSVPTLPLTVDLNDYDRIVICCPVWAGYPAPAFNAIAKQLPAGKEVELFLCPGGSGTQKSMEGTKALIEKRGCTVISYQDVHTGVMPGKMKQ